MARTALLICVSLSSLVACASAPPPPPPPPARAEVTALESEKPEASKRLERGARPKLEEYLDRVLVGKKLEGEEEPIESVELVQARLFEEGHIHETWYLAVDIDGHMNHAALKIFADDEAARENAEHFAAAKKHGWPVPTEIIRGSTAPYSDRPSLLMEFIVGGSLKRWIEKKFELPGADPPPEDLAAPYGELAEMLGFLHRGAARPRRPDDPVDRPAMEKMIGRCAKDGWCDAAAQKRMKALAAQLDQGPVTFCHGDLYESQVMMSPKGRLKAILDLDLVGFADGASDLGGLLAHVLLINRYTRENDWGIRAPSEAEMRATAERILEGYRKRSKLTGAEWPAFMHRVRAYMWLRLGDVMVRYRKSKQAQYLLEAFADRKSELCTEDPLETLGLAPPLSPPPAPKE